MTGSILTRCFLLVIVITCLNYIYRLTYYQKDLAQHSPEILALKSSQDSTDVYYFGESSNVTFHPSDSTHKSISELMSQFFPGLRVTTINKYATHAGIYKHWLLQLDRHRKMPSAVVITMNLRSFDAAWRHSKLETQLQQSLVLTRPYPAIINRFLLSLQAFDNLTDEQREQLMLDEWEREELSVPYPGFPYHTTADWNRSVANGGYLKPDGSWDMEKIELACHYIKAYAFNLDFYNQRVKDFDDMVKWCESNSVKLYLNLMAENVAYADSLAGKPLTYLMRKNTDFLVKRYSKNSVVVVNNLEAVDGSDFIDQRWTTEHYNLRGRMTIASNLASAMKAQFPTQYFKSY